MSRDVGASAETDYEGSSLHTADLERFNLPLQLSLAVGEQSYLQVASMQTPDAFGVGINVAAHTAELKLSPAKNLDLFLAALRIAPRFSHASSEGTGWTVVADPDMSVTVMDDVVAVVADSGCRWGALAFYVRGLGRTRPISLFARVRSRGKAEVVASSWDGPAPGSSEPLHRSTNYGCLEDWTWICLSASFFGSSSMERLTIGCHHCDAGDGFEIDFLEILDGRISILDAVAGGEHP